MHLKQLKTSENKLEILMKIDSHMIIHFHMDEAFSQKFIGSYSFLQNTQGWQNAGKYEYFPCQWHLPVNTGIYWKIPANTGKLNLPHWN